MDVNDFFSSLNPNFTGLVVKFKSCSQFKYSNHVFLQMAERAISADAVEAVATRGKVIRVYADERPFPCFLLLGRENLLALHVIAQNQSDATCIVVTAYWPDPEQWSADFKTRLKR